MRLLLRYVYTTLLGSSSAVTCKNLQVGSGVIKRTTETGAVALRRPCAASNWSVDATVPRNLISDWAGPGSALSRPRARAAGVRERVGVVVLGPLLAWAGFGFCLDASPRAGMVCRTRAR